MLSSVLTLALLAPGPQQAPIGAGAAVAGPADVVWRYDTGG